MQGKNLRGNDQKVYPPIRTLALRRLFGKGVCDFTELSRCRHESSECHLFRPPCFAIRIAAHRGCWMSIFRSIFLADGSRTAYSQSNFNETSKPSSGVTRMLTPPVESCSFLLVIHRQ